MTVVSVYGCVNRHDVIYKYIGDDHWECYPGEPENGIYVTEVWAKDDAGNISYKLARLYIYDGRCVKIEWIPDDFFLEYMGCCEGS